MLAVSASRMLADSHLVVLEDGFRKSLIENVTMQREVLLIVNQWLAQRNRNLIKN